MTAVLVALVAPTGTTFASYSDSARVSGNTAGAGIWAPDPPAACGTVAGYTRVVYGTPGDDVLLGGNQRQVLMGLGGDDVIRGGNGGDCLVGGPGSDRLYGGNGKDVLIGGESEDLLEGNNGKDLLDGGPGIDTCVGGNGVDQLQECEAGDVGPPAPLRVSTTPSPPSPSSVNLPVAPLTTGTPTPALGNAAVQADGGASVEEPPGAPLVEPFTAEVSDAVDQEPEGAATPPVARDEVQP